jgi:hypothetical protein
VHESIAEAEKRPEFHEHQFMGPIVAHSGDFRYGCLHNYAKKACARGNNAGVLSL